MNLIIDRGNTLVKLAVFDGDDLIFVFRERQVTNQKLETVINSFGVKHVIVSSVAPVAFDEHVFSSVDTFIELTHETPIPFQNLYRTPETLGRDRIAAVAGAVSEFPGRPLLVIDTGTCIKTEFINGQGVYLGGNISPGPILRYRAMHEGTSALPLVDIPTTWKWIGVSTETALQNGGFAASIAEIRGWIAIARERFDDPVVVLSGGDAESFATWLKNEIFVRPDLVLSGLNKILQLNVKT